MSALFRSIFTILFYKTRDIGGSDPERMAPPRVEEYVKEVFKGTNISVEVSTIAYLLKVHVLRKCIGELIHWGN